MSSVSVENVFVFEDWINIDLELQEIPKSHVVFQFQIFDKRMHHLSLPFKFLPIEKCLPFEWYN